LRNEIERYLRSRCEGALREQPLATVEASQGYVHYNKGSAIVYELKERMGEDKFNAALRKLVEKFGYKPPPYPTSKDLIDLLREQAGPELQDFITDRFEKMTLYSNRTKTATYRERDDGQFEVTVEVETKKYLADETRCRNRSPHR
jgi:ABC-2 type transport system permease protein